MLEKKAKYIKPTFKNTTQSVKNKLHFYTQ